MPVSDPEIQSQIEAARGIDAVPGMIAVAQQITPGVEWRQGKAESLPFSDDSFDVVVSQFGLSHRDLTAGTFALGLHCHRQTRFRALSFD